MDRRKKYQYKVVDLEDKVLFEARSMHDIARKIGVTVDTIAKRVNHKVFKNSDFRKKECKFNVIREEL